MREAIAQAKQALILGSWVDVVDRQDCMERLAAFVDSGASHHVITLNAEIVYQAQYDEALRRIINGADLVTPDGIGVVWAGRKLGHAFTERVTGIDLLHQICGQAAKAAWSMYFLGAGTGVAEQAAENLRQQYPGLQIVGTHDGYFSEEQLPALLEELTRLSPDLLFVALGAPRQEFFIDRYRHDLGIKVLIGVGGSFDVIAGLKRRAPGWMIRLNLEWLYRLVDEPQRWRRQLALPKFMWAVFKQSRRKNLTDNI